MSVADLATDLDRRRDLLGRLEQERADLRIEVEAFQIEYTARVGQAQTELERLEMHIAEYRLRNELIRLRRGALDAHRLESEVDWQLRGRREQFAGYRESVRRAESAVDAQQAAPEPIDVAALKSVYRDVAKRVHPDLAVDDADRETRGRLMAQANEAYARSDRVALQSLLFHLTDSNSRTSPLDADALRAEIERIDRAIATLRSEISELNRSAWMSMKIDASLARSRGVDWFGHARHQIDAQVARRRVELDGLIAEFRDLVRRFGLA